MVCSVQTLLKKGKEADVLLVLPPAAPALASLQGSGSVASKADTADVATVAAELARASAAFAAAVVAARTAATPGTTSNNSRSSVPADRRSSPTAVQLLAARAVAKEAADACTALSRQLYLRLLEAIIGAETSRQQLQQPNRQPAAKHAKASFCRMLQSNLPFHASLAACAAHIVQHLLKDDAAGGAVAVAGGAAAAGSAADSVLPFASVLRAYAVPPHEAFKVIETVVRCEPLLSDALVGLLAAAETEIMTRQVWEAGSPFFDVVSTSTVSSDSSDSDGGGGGSSSDGSSGGAPSVADAAPELLAAAAMAASEGHRGGGGRRSAGGGGAVDPAPLVTFTPPQSSKKKHAMAHAKKGQAGASPTSASASASHQPTDEKLKPKPKTRSRSLQIFFRKMYTVAHARLVRVGGALIVSPKEMTAAWACFEAAMTHGTHLRTLLEGRHVDHVLLSSLYVVCKVGGPSTELKFKAIIAAHNAVDDASWGSQITEHVYLGTQASLSTASSRNGGRGKQSPLSNAVSTVAARPLPPVIGSVVDYYNTVFVPEMKEYLLGATAVHATKTVGSTSFSIQGRDADGEGTPPSRKDGATAAARAAAANDLYHRLLRGGSGSVRSSGAGSGRQAAAGDSHAQSPRSQKFAEVVSSPRGKLLYSFPESPLHAAAATAAAVSAAVTPSKHGSMAALLAAGIAAGNAATASEMVGGEEVPSRRRPLKRLLFATDSEDDDDAVAGGASAGSPAGTVTAAATSASKKVARTVARMNPAAAAF